MDRVRLRVGRLAAALLVLFVILPAAAGAGTDAADTLSCPTETGCLVANGRYRIALPKANDPGGRVGAVMFFHGWQGSAEETLADEGLIAAAQRLGVALIAPDGMGRTWSYPGSPGRHRDEFAFVDAVLADVTARFPVDPRRIMAAGFSQGASMVWYLACYSPDRFAAFTAFSGAFWRPQPERCAGAMPAIVHFHGLADATVPMSGRKLRNGFQQGDVTESMAIRAGACAADLGAAATDGALTCREARGCGSGRLLTLCLHAGGHDFDRAWLDKAWRAAMP